MTKIDTSKLKGITTLLKEGGKLALIGTAFMLTRPSTWEYIADKLSEDSEVTYSDAVTAIMNSGMFGSDKVKATNLLAKNGDSEYFRSVVSIVKSGMFGSDKVKLIQNLTQHIPQKDE